MKERLFVKKLMIGLAVLTEVALCADAAEATGPKVSILGDSYSTYADVSLCDFPYYGSSSYVPASELSQDQTYWMQFINDVGGTLEVNHSVGGAPMCGSFGDWVSTLGSPDVILIFGAMNDDWGTESVDTATFQASIETVFSTVKKTYPEAKVFVLVNHLTVAGFGHRNGLKENTRTALFNAATKAGFTAVDLDLDPATDMTWPNGDCHPNVSGMTKIAAQLKAAYDAVSESATKGDEPSVETYPVVNEFFATDDITVNYTAEDGALLVSFTNTMNTHSFVLRTDAVLEEALIVGGGGSGGWTIGGGGGGGGVVVLEDAIDIAAGVKIDVKVGAGGICPKDGSGGTGANNKNWVVGQNGEYSRVAFDGHEYMAYGGGAGATWDKPRQGVGEVIKPDDRSGGYVGSSGGAAHGSTCDVDASAGQGNKGGSSVGSGPGGGGGASTAGGDGSSKYAGDGGEGRIVRIGGKYQVYGSGGGGGAAKGFCEFNGRGGTNAGAGSVAESNLPGGNAVDGFGGGGGGGSYKGSAGSAGGDGGSGTVILKFKMRSENPSAHLEVASQGAASAVISLSMLNPGMDAESCDISLAYWREGIDAEDTPEPVASDVTDGDWSTVVGGVLSGVAYHFRVVLTNDRSLETVLDLVTTPFAVGQAKVSEPEFTYSSEEYEKIQLFGSYAVRLLSSGTLTPIGDIAVEEMLLVGGGGAGGWTIGGGGGGGGVLDIKESIVLKAGVGYSVVVGSGGTIGGGSSWVNGGNGGDTTFIGLTAYGGGGGNAWDMPDAAPSGGCGGGDAGGTKSQENTAPGKGRVGQGYDGGARDGECPGGGGGAGGPGGNGGSGKAGNGGEGYESDIAGESEVYGSGGGGGAGNSCNTAGKGGTNAGDGAAKNSNAVGGSGKDGFGGGGGGGSYQGATAGGNGGSGVVIFRTVSAAGCSLDDRELNGSTLTAAFSRAAATGSIDIYMGVGSTYSGWDVTAWDSFDKVGAFEADALQAGVTVDDLPSDAEYVIFRFGNDGAWSEALVLDELVPEPVIELVSLVKSDETDPAGVATVDVTWAGRGCERVTAEIWYREQGTEDAWQVAKSFENVIGQNVFEFKLPGDKTYEVKVVASNANGASAESAAMEIKMQQGKSNFAIFFAMNDEEWEEEFETFEEAMEAAQEATASGYAPTIKVLEEPDAPVEIPGVGRVDASKEVVFVQEDETFVPLVQTSTEIMREVTAGGRALTANTPKLREFLTENRVEEYTALSATAAAISEALAEVPTGEDANGLPLWKDYALGITPTTSVKAVADAAKDTDPNAITISIPTIDPQNASGDFTVSYQVTDRNTKELKTTATDPRAIKIPLATGIYDVKIVFAPTT